MTKLEFAKSRLLIAADGNSFTIDTQRGYNKVNSPVSEHYAPFFGKVARRGVTDLIVGIYAPDHSTAYLTLNEMLFSTEMPDEPMLENELIDWVKDNTDRDGFVNGYKISSLDEVPCDVLDTMIEFDVLNLKNFYVK